MKPIKIVGANASLGRFFLWSLLLLLFSSFASAAELRGRIWDAKTGKAPAKGSLKVSCGGNPNPHSLVGSGSYSIRNVPNGICTLTVNTSNGSASRTITINKPVVQFNGETRKAGNKIFLVPR